MNGNARIARELVRVARELLANGGQKAVTEAFGQHVDMRIVKTSGVFKYAAHASYTEDYELLDVTVNRSGGDKIAIESFSAGDAGDINGRGLFSSVEIDEEELWEMICDRFEYVKKNYDLNVVDALANDLAGGGLEFTIGVKDGHSFPSYGFSGGDYNNMKEGSRLCFVNDLSVHFNRMGRILDHDISSCCVFATINRNFVNWYRSSFPAKNISWPDM